MTYIAKTFFFLSLFGALLTGPVFGMDLRLATFSSPPKHYISDGKVTGLWVEAVREALKRMHVRSTIELYPLPRCLLMARQGIVDGVIGISRKKERKEYITYPQTPICNLRFFMFKLRDRDISLKPDFSNAQNYVLGVRHGFYFGRPLERAIAEDKFKRVEETWDIEQNLAKLLVGRIDMLVEDQLTVDYYLEKINVDGKMDRVKITGTDKPLLIDTLKAYLGFSKKKISPQFVEKFSKTLMEMSLDGTTDRLKVQYRNAATVK